MKKLLVIAAIALSGVCSYAQGTFTLANGAPGVNSPISDSNGALISQTDFWIQAYVGPQTADAGALTALGAPFRANLAAGYFGQGVQAIPGVAAGAVGTVQIRAWSSTEGATSYEQAAGIIGAQIGTSNLVNVTLAGGQTPPPNLVGLESFQLTVVPVPEPSVIALAILGGGLLLFRRKK